MNRIVMRKPVFRHMPKAHEHMRRERCRQAYVPSNIIRKENAFTIQLAVPGLRKEDFDISVAENLLSIKVKLEKQEEKKTYRLKQFDYSHFEKRFELGEDIDRDHLEASYENGILTLSLMLKDQKESEIIKKIEIK
jgi:HSP20 family protein